MPEIDTSSRPAIFISGLKKSFGATEALAGIDLEIGRGKILSLLGPNGAGKTTLIRILATLLKPDSGHAEIFGYSVTRYASSLRKLIGVTGQFAAIDENLTGRENLELVGRLYHLDRREVRKRATSLLEQFELLENADRVSKTYSGGMRRRLDLACSLIGRPYILFLDEPTTGLDPLGRMRLWKMVKQLVAGGVTVLLTTQYLEEADQLADKIAVINHGRLIAEGTADELKSRVGGDVIDMRIKNPALLQNTAHIISKFGAATAHIEYENQRIVLPVKDGASVLPEIIRELDAAGVAISDLALHRPTLDDVFISLTGRAAMNPPISV